jgi:hypothetical protein
VIRKAFLLCCAIFLASCGGGDPVNTLTPNISDSRFNGEFNYSSSPGANEIKDTLTFNGSTVAINLRTTKSTISAPTGSVVETNELRRNIEFDLSASQFRYRVVGADNQPTLWGSDSNQWSSWSAYSFNTDGTALTLTGPYATNAIGQPSIVLTKK